MTSARAIPALGLLFTALVAPSCGSNGDFTPSDPGTGTAGTSGGTAGSGGGSATGGTMGASGGAHAGSGGAHAGSGGAGATGGVAGASGGSGGAATSAGGVSGGAGQAAGGVAGGGAGGSGGGGSGGASGGHAGAAGAAAGMSGAAGAGGAAAGQAGASGQAGAGGAMCIPTATTETVCNDIDDDCNGIIDDVDVGHDGVCDCLRIGIIGIPGSNPSSNFQKWLTDLGTTVQRVDTTTADSFDGTLLAKFDIAVVDQLVRPYTAAEADAFRVWVEGGGGFVTMSGYTGAAAPDFYPNALLEAFGLSYGGPLSSATADMFFPHPVTVGVTSVTFYGGYVVTSMPGMGGTSTAIASNANGTVGYAYERGLGRGVIWGDEWIEYDSEWSSMPQIQKLWVNIMSWVGPRTSCIVAKP